MYRKMENRTCEHPTEICHVNTNMTMCATCTYCKLFYMHFEVLYIINNNLSVLCLLFYYVMILHCQISNHGFFYFLNPAKKLSWFLSEMQNLSTEIEVSRTGKYMHGQWQRRNGK